MDFVKFIGDLIVSKHAESGPESVDKSSGKGAATAGRTPFKSARQLVLWTPEPARDAVGACWVRGWRATVQTACCGCTCVSRELCGLSSDSLSRPTPPGG